MRAPPFLGASLAGAAILAAGLGAPAHPYLIDAVTRAPAPDAVLAAPPLYTALAPFTTTLDALTLLSLHQHYAVLATLALAYAAWRIARARRHHPRTRHRLRTVIREMVLAILALVVWVGVYAAGALLPRPMSSIRMLDPSYVTVDFHSHTDASWDGRRGFDAADNRAWHSAAGFDAAYVSDHRSMAGAAAGMRGNPPRAGTGITVLLPAIEARDRWEHVIAIGIDTTFRFDPRGDWYDPPATDPAHPPLLVLAIPGNLRKIPPNEIHGNARLAAIELADAAPKGIGAIQRDRAEILALADTLRLALVAGSDNHGWGRTAAAWTAMRIPGWRTLTPDSLDRAITYAIRTRGTAAARVLERPSPDPGRSRLALALTVPAVTWTLLRNLTWGERVSWIIWLAAALLIARAATRNTSSANRP